MNGGSLNAQTILEIDEGWFSRGKEISLPCEYSPCKLEHPSRHATYKCLSVILKALRLFNSREIWTHLLSYESDPKRREMDGGRAEWKKWKAIKQRELLEHGHKMWRHRSIAALWRWWQRPSKHSSANKHEKPVIILRGNAMLRVTSAEGQNKFNSLLHDKMTYASYPWDPPSEGKFIRPTRPEVGAP